MSSFVAMIGQKIGMSTVYLETGEMLPVTVVSVPDSYLMSCKSKAKDGYDALVMVGGGEQREHRTNKPQLSVFKKAGIAPQSVQKEFRFAFDAKDISKIVGNTFALDSALIGEVVDVTSVSKGKGFQGGMKRHGFRGLRASHGVSVSHRSLGSTGQRTLPGKVLKGKKMAGHMGATTITMQGLRLHDVDVVNKLLFIHGSVPGHIGSTVFIKSTTKMMPASSINVFNGMPINSDLV